MRLQFMKNTSVKAIKLFLWLAVMIHKEHEVLSIDNALENVHQRYIVAKNNKTRFFYVLYSDKTRVFDQSERA